MPFKPLFKRDIYFTFCRVLFHFLQGEDKLGSHSGGTDYVDSLAMSPDNLFCDGKSQTGSLLILAPGVIRLIEAFKDSGLILFGNSASVILDGDKNLLIAVIGLQVNAGILRGI